MRSEYNTYLTGLLEGLITTGYTVKVMDEQSYNLSSDEKEISVKISFLSPSKLYKDLDNMKYPFVLEFRSEKNGFEICDNLMMSLVKTYSKAEITLGTESGYQEYFGPTYVGDFDTDGKSGYRSVSEVTGNLKLGSEGDYTTSIEIDGQEVFCLTPVYQFNNILDSNEDSAQTTYGQESLAQESGHKFTVSFVKKRTTLDTKLLNVMSGTLPNSTSFSYTRTFDSGESLIEVCLIETATLTENTTEKVGVFEVTFVKLSTS